MASNSTKTILAIVNTCFQAYVTLDKISHVTHRENRQCLFDKYTKQFVDSLKDEHIIWTQHSPEKMVFETLLLESGR